MMSSAKYENRGFFRRHAFELSLGSFVLICSFLYGITAGLMRRAGEAQAGVREMYVMDDDVQLERLTLPRGVTAVPLGRDVTINGHDAEVVSFVSDRSAVELVREQTAQWKAAGIQVVGTSGERRGFAIGISPDLSERYSFSAWTVPPELRAHLTNGKPVQGMMAIADAGQHAEAQDGTVPEVPVREGGKGGAVFSALDPGGRSFTGAYTNPGTIADNIEFYRAELTAGGWNELSAGLDRRAGGDYEVGNLVFQRGPEELVLLFSPARREAGAEVADSTVVAVTRQPFRFERWRTP